MKWLINTINSKQHIEIYYPLRYFLIHNLDNTSIFPLAVLYCKCARCCTWTKHVQKLFTSYEYFLACSYFRCYMHTSVFIHFIQMRFTKELTTTSLIFSALWKVLSLMNEICTNLKTSNIQLFWILSL